MKTAILTIGDELLIGQVLNSNAQWLSEKLTAIGVRVQTHQTIGDEIPTIQNTITQLAKDHELILIGGGLGPTSDDVTVEALTGLLGRPLKHDQEWYDRVKEFFASRGREMPPNNFKQALIPEGAERLDNHVGTAPGLWIEWKNTTLVVFPGVPYEMKFLFEKFILPRLEKKAGGQKIIQRTFLTTGIGESALAVRIQTVESLLNENLKLAYLPSIYGVRLRITAYADSSNQTQVESQMKIFADQLIPLLGRDYYGEGDEEIETVIGKLLVQQGKTVATAESCTGGLVAHRLTQIPGSSRYVQGGIVAYQNSVKINELAVDAKVIESQTAVCETVARQMAEGVRKKFGTSLGLATTGILGPDGGSETQPVGLIYIGIADEKGTDFRKLLFEKDRIRNKERAAQSALDFLRRRLLS